MAQRKLDNGQRKRSILDWEQDRSISRALDASTGNLTMRRNIR